MKGVLKVGMDDGVKRWAHAPMEKQKLVTCGVRSEVAQKMAGHGAVESARADGFKLGEGGH